jgi:hypothetical protein
MLGHTELSQRALFSSHNTAALLEVLVATKISSHMELGFVAVESGCALQDCRVEASRAKLH